jgi:hypothetical protein
MQSATAAPPDRHPRQAAGNGREALLILALFLLTRLFVVGAGTAVNLYLPHNPELGDEAKYLLDGGPALDMWYRWDAGFYATVATEGFDWVNTGELSGDMAFLPLYPALVRVVMNATGCTFSPYLSTCATVSGLLVSNLALLGAAWLLYDLTRRRFNRRVALLTALFLLLSPNSIFLSGVYTESLFLLLTIATFWLLEHNRFGAAIVIASCAALTRSVGFALALPLLWHIWTLHGQAQTELTQRLRAVLTDRRAYLALLPVLIFSGYVLLAGVSVGDPLAYFKSYQVVWQRDVTRAPWQTLLAYFSGDAVSLYGAQLSWIDLFAFVACLAVVGFTWRYDVGWALFSLAATLIPFASGTLTAMPRFAAVLFPLYILLALWSTHRWRLLLALAISIGLMLLFIARFVTWRWIA